MPYLILQFFALILWFSVPAISVIPLWVILIPLYVVIAQVLVVALVFGWAVAVVS